MRITGRPHARRLRDRRPATSRLSPAGAAERALRRRWPPPPVRSPRPASRRRDARSGWWCSPGDAPAGVRRRAGSEWQSLRTGPSYFAPSPGEPGLGPFGLRTLSPALRRLLAGSLAAYLHGRHRIAANASQIFPKVRTLGMRTQPGTRSGKNMRPQAAAGVVDADSHRAVAELLLLRKGQLAVAEVTFSPSNATIRLSEMAIL